MASSSKSKHAKSNGGRKGWKVFFGGLFVLIATAVVFFVVDYVINKDHVPRGSTVAGIDLSTLSAHQAADKLEKELGNVAAKPVTIKAGEKESTLVPENAGLDIDWDGTVAQAGKQTANPITWVKSFFTQHELHLVSATKEPQFVPELDRVHQELTIPAKNGEVKLEAGKVQTVDPIIGQNVDPEELRDAITKGWLIPGGVTVDTTPADPEIDAEDVKAAAEGEAKTAVSAPIVAKGRENINGEIPVERMGEVVTFVPEDKKLKAKVDTEKAQAILNENLAKSEVKKQNAVVSLAGGAPSVTPSKDGVIIEWDATMKDFADRVTSTDKRQFDVAYKDEPATFTTEEAEKATFDDVIGEFTTGGFVPASGTNIALVAQIVDGAFVAPGETFSLNGYTGPRGTAQGFVESGIILNGHADKAVGGGISQFATTLYNAAYFAGMEDVTHTPHSYYISRYPAGREATVFEGAIDLQFKNTSKFPVIIRASASSSDVTVQILGTKTVNVESVNGGRWAYTSPQQMSLSGDTCAPSSGSQGFTTSDTRIISDLNGNEISRETQTTVYDPQPIVTCS